MGIHDRDYMRRDNETGHTAKPWPLIIIVLICFAAATANWLFAGRQPTARFPLDQEYVIEDAETTQREPADSIEIKLLNANLATYDELVQIPYINRKIALSLLQQRPFSKWEDLMSVYGIGPKRLESLKLFLYISEPSPSEKHSEYTLPIEPSQKATTNQLVP